jgi:hypothetical protein
MRHLASIDGRKLLFRKSGVGLTSSALHRLELLGVLGQFAPLLVNLAEAVVRSRL